MSHNAGDRRPRLCYVLQVYDEDSTDCSPHLYRFLEELAGRVSLFVVIEKAQGTPRLRGAQRIYCQRWRNRMLRLVEVMAVLLWARWLGYPHIFVRYSQSAMFAAPLLRLLGARVYYWNCGMMKQFFRPWSLHWRDWLYKLTIEFPLWFSLRTATCVVTGTEGMARYYVEQFRLDPSRVVVVPNDVDVEGFLRGADGGSRRAEREPTILYVGRLDRANGADRLPAIAEGVCRHIPSARFLVVGDGFLEETLRREIEARGLASAMQLVGPVPNRDVARLFAQADVFVLPAMAEGMPRVLLESMAAGVPFVATAVGGVPDLVTPAQRRWLVAPGDAAAFAARVVEMLRHPKIRQALRQEGWRRVQDFSRQRICELFMDRILDQRTPQQEASLPAK